jgi:hypothetical protein
MNKLVRIFLTAFATAGAACLVARSNSTTPGIPSLSAVLRIAGVEQRDEIRAAGRIHAGRYAILTIVSALAIDSQLPPNRSQAVH